MLQGPLFMSMGWCSSLLPNPVTAPWNGSPRRESCSSVRHLFRRRMCGKRQCSRQNMKQMLTRPGALQGSAPGLGVRVMGCARGRGRGVNGYRDMVRSAGALPGDILELRGRCGMSVWSGYVRLRDRFASYWHIVSRHNCYYSEILRNLRELFRD